MNPISALGVWLYDTVLDSFIPKLFNTVMLAALGGFAVAITVIPSLDAPSVWFKQSLIAGVFAAVVIVVAGFVYGLIYGLQADGDLIIRSRASSHLIQLYSLAAGQAGRVFNNTTEGGVAGAAAMISFVYPGVTFYSPPFYFIANLFQGTVLAAVFTRGLTCFPLGILDYFMQGGFRDASGVVAFFGFFIWFGFAVVAWFTGRYLVMNIFTTGVGLVVWLWSWTPWGQHLRAAFTVRPLDAMEYARKNPLPKVDHPVDGPFGPVWAE